MPPAPAAALDQANRRQLTSERARLEDECERLRRELAGRRFPRLFDNRRSDLWYAQRKLEDIAAAQQALSEHPDAKLILLDMRYGVRGKAAIAIGDVDSADRVSVAVPGMNATVALSMVDMAREAAALREIALEISRRHNADQTMAAVVWIGYEPPQTELPTRSRGVAPGPGWGDGATGLMRLLRAERAKTGASDLAGFLRGLGHPGLTVLGHSYGSLTASLALQQLPKGVVQDAVFYGSAGIGASSVEQLGLEPGHVYAMQAPGDMIRRANRWFGHPVVELPWIRRLATHAGVGPGDGADYEGVFRHADYPRPGSNGRLRISGYNMACVLAGFPELAVYGA